MKMKNKVYRVGIGRILPHSEEDDLTSIGQFWTIQTLVAQTAEQALQKAKLIEKEYVASVELIAILDD